MSKQPTTFLFSLSLLGLSKKYEIVENCHSRVNGNPVPEQFYRFPLSRLCENRENNMCCHSRENGNLLIYNKIWIPCQARNDMKSRFSHSLFRGNDNKMYFLDSPKRKLHLKILVILITIWYNKV